MQRQRRLLERLDWAITDYARCPLKSCTDRAANILRYVAWKVSAEGYKSFPSFLEKTKFETLHGNF